MTILWIWHELFFISIFKVHTHTDEKKMSTENWNKNSTNNKFVEILGSVLQMNMWRKWDQFE